jgi:serine/threonine protein kinase
MEPVIDVRDGKTVTISSFFEVTDLIGSGRFAQVYKAYNSYHGIDVALKLYLGTDEETGKIAKKEDDVLSILSELNTDYFPQPKGLRSHKRHPMIAMELGEYAEEDGRKNIISLKDVLPNVDSDEAPAVKIQEFWKIESVVSFILDLCDAVCVLHRQDIIHRDLKPSNILLKRLPGEANCKPLFLDFNTSVRSGENAFLGGTEKYLPPEVRSGKRLDPDPLDDLWSLASIIWELIFGIGQKVKKGLKEHNLINFKTPKELVNVLTQALSLKQNNRYSTAEDLFSAVQSSLPTPYRIDDEDGEEEGQDDVYLTSDELVWARESHSSLRDDIMETLAGENEIPVSKAIRDKVAFIYTMLSKDDTQSFDLKSDLVRLGPKSIPAIIEDGYKVPTNTSVFEDIIEVLVELAEHDNELAIASINTYCLSSDYVVRKMCLSLCEKLDIFPTVLIDSILEDNALYLPEERVYIADLCIRNSTDSSVMLSLNNYMCREYILDQQMYYELRDKIAVRVRELDFDQKSRLIVEDAKFRIWEDLLEYEELDEESKDRVDRGVLQLFADAFASLEEEALEFVKKNTLPQKCQEGQRFIASLFLRKLAEHYEPARKWLFETLVKKPTHDALFAAQRLSVAQSEEEEKICAEAAIKLGVRRDDGLDILKVFERYLHHGTKADLNILCWEGLENTLNLIEKEMTGKVDDDKLRKILVLLSRFENRYRYKIIRIIYRSWNEFSRINYNLAVHVLTEYKIPDDATKQDATELLKNDLNTDKHDIAVRGLKKLLK